MCPREAPMANVVPVQEKARTSAPIILRCASCPLPDIPHTVTSEWYSPSEPRTLRLAANIWPSAEKAIEPILPSGESVVTCRLILQSQSFTPLPVPAVARSLPSGENASDFNEPRRVE